MIDRQFRVRVVTTHKAGAKRERWYDFGDNAIAAEDYAAHYTHHAKDTNVSMWFNGQFWMSGGHTSRFRHPEDYYV